MVPDLPMLLTEISPSSYQKNAAADCNRGEKLFWYGIEWACITMDVL